MIEIKNSPSRNQKIRRARTCYRHPAGRLGVQFLDFLIAGEYLTIHSEVCLTPRGKDFFREFVPDFPNQKTRKPLLRLCQDGTEKRPHLAGILGDALTQYFLQNGWFVRDPDCRALLPTPRGLDVLREKFGIEL